MGMRVRFATSLILVLCTVAIGCGDDRAERAAGATSGVEVVAPNPPESGAEFEVAITTDEARSPTWILSKDGEDLYTLGAVERSAAPHYFPIDGAIDVSSVAISSASETLVWPHDLASGTYTLCNFHPDDLCVTITVDG